MAVVRLGTSGWSYNHWIGRFYPSKLDRNKWLEFLSTRFDTVEVNMTFYRYPSRKLLKGWYERSPRDFKFALKLNRLITHQKKLENVEKNLDSFLSLAKELKERLGPILVQLPPSYHKDKEGLARLSEFLKILPFKQKFAFEFRHKSWFNEDTMNLLKEHDVAYCIISAPAFTDKCWLTADFSYIRWHGITNWYRYDYSKNELKEWASRVKKLSKSGDVWGYFNNDFEANAPRNCKQLRELLQL